MKNKRLKIICIFMLFASMAMCATAKYYELITIESKTKISNPIIEIEYDKKKIVYEIDRAEIEYCFCIKNYNAVSVNKANLLYKVIIINTVDNSDIHYELFKENDKIELINDQTEYKKLSTEKCDERYKLKLKIENEKPINGKINIKIEVVQEDI